MSERIILQFDNVDASRDLAFTAAVIAFDFATFSLDRPRGFGHGIGYLRHDHVWFAYRTKAGAIVVRCQREVSNG